MLGFDHGLKSQFIDFYLNYHGIFVRFYLYFNGCWLIPIAKLYTCMHW